MMRILLLFFNTSYVAWVLALCSQGFTLAIEGDSSERNVKAAYSIMVLSGVVGMVEGIRNCIWLMCNDVDNEEKLTRILERCFAMAIVIFSCHLLVALLPVSMRAPECLSFGYPYIAWNIFALMIFFVMLL